MSNFYALLIGINYYEKPNNGYDHLKGAVQDIDSVGNYLQETLKIPAKNITRLTSPLPDTNSLADVRAQRNEQPPTYKNIVNAFKDLTNQAKMGDQVYIHYSGHGGRAKTIYPELQKLRGDYDEGIVPMDVGMEGRYLRDLEIATLLKNMTDKGLIATLVFDSCHSGGATRGEDVAIRGNVNPDESERLTDSLVADKETLINNWKILTKTGNTDNWLPHNDDYVFIGACLPNQFAYESVFEGTTRSGALTHWMLDTLNASYSKLTYKALYNRVKSMIQSRFQDQLPVLMGKSDRLVFGDQTVATPTTIGVEGVNEDKTEVTLNAGASSGLMEETRLAIYPFDTDINDKSNVVAMVEIDEIQADKCTARVLTEEEGGMKINIDLDDEEQLKKFISGNAVILSLPTTLIHKVRLFDEKIEGEAEDELPAELVDKQGKILDKIHQALTNNEAKGWLQEAQGEEKGDYQVAVGRKGEYEICVGKPLTNLGKPLSIDDEDAPAQVVRRLVHLAKYQSALSIDNPASQLTNDIEYELLDAKTKKPFPNPDKIELKSGDRVYVRVKNTSNQDLKIAVLDFEATWEISQIPILGYPSPFLSLQPGQNTETRIRFEVPDGKDYKQITETLKLFATRGAANFQWLKLPRLDEEIGRKGDLNKQLEEEATRSGISPLNKLLSTIGADLDNPPELTRASYDPDPNAEWLTKSITVTVAK